MDILRLVNADYGLSREFKPCHLMQDSFSKIWLCRETFWGIRKVNATLYRLGLEQVVIISGYRPYDYQEKLFMRKTNYYREQGLDEEAARLQAAQIVAKPGHSEHQLGLAVDLTVWSMKNLADPLITAFEETTTGKWLSENIYRYGFILRYPKNKVEITNITYEPWHYRYVGKAAAYAMHQKQICLEEYLGAYKG